MHINILHNGDLKIAEVVSDGIMIKNARDALDIIVNCNTQAIILYEQNIDPGFFDLSTRICGEILQKAVNYGVRLAIVGDFAKYPGKSLQDFIYETNKRGQVFFVSSLAQAINGLAQGNTR